MNIEADEKFLEWLDTIEATKATRSSYFTHMKKFCECVGKTPDELITESIIEVKEGKLPAERKTKGYVAKFKKCLSDKGAAPKSQQSALAALKSFFKSYDMPLSQSIARSKKAQVLEANTGFLMREDVIKLVANAKNLREKAIILSMATSGMAIKEVIDLMIGDIEIDNEGIGTIKVRREKSHTDYTTFISPEAAIALKTYWDERNRDPGTRIKGKDDFVFVSYGNRSKGEQLNQRTLSHLFNILGNQLGYGNGDGFIKSRSHALRKYFASTLEDNGFPKPKIEFMMGHTISDIDKAYYNRDPSKLKELYKTYLPYITFEKTIEVRSLDTKDAERLEALEKENLNLRRANFETKAAYEEMNRIRGEMDYDYKRMQSQVQTTQKEMETLTASGDLTKMQADIKWLEREVVDARSDMLETMMKLMNIKDEDLPDLVKLKTFQSGRTYVREDSSDKKL